MWKAVLFDDEYIVLKGLETMIDWAKYGIELVGTASNGQEALDLFRVQRPNIVFTDIRMPGIDGLQVVETILAEAPETQCIIFSGFNEFEYVKRALKLGVVDYVEKPITIPLIEEAIEKTMERIDQQQVVSTLKSSRERERLEKVTLRLLLGHDAEEYWRECFGAAANNIVGVTVVAMSADVLPPPSSPTYRLIPVQNGSEHVLVACHFHHDADDLWEQLLYWPERVNIAVGSGRTYRLQDAARSYRESLQALRYGQFMGGTGWTRFEDIGENPDIPDCLSEHEKSIIFHMRTGDKDGLLLQLDSLIRQLESERLHPDITEREVLKLIYLGMEVAKETGKDIYEMYQADYLPHVEIRRMNTKEKMFGWLRTQMEMMMDWTLQVRSSSKHEAVEKACVYMKKHYAKDLTLQEVSEHVGMNPTYFSLLFKEEMGQSYIKYVTQLRIERAKELLQSGNKVADVSERVGYHSYRHFSELFKKYVGVSPGQYRE